MNDGPDTPTTTTPAAADPGSAYDPSVTTGSQAAGTAKDASDDSGDDLSYLDELLSEGDDFVEPPKADTKDAKDTSGETKETKPEEKTPPTTEVKEATETPPQQKEAETKPAETPVQGKEQGTQETQQQPQAAAEPAPSMTPEEASRAYQKFFDDSVGLLAEKVYAFDDETKEKLDSAPSEVLPKLAARLHMQIMTATLTQAANLFPLLMTQHTERVRDYQEQEDKFFGDYPDLKPHRAQVERVAAVYRQLNPKASFDEATKQIAAMTRVQLQLPIPSLAPQTTAAPAATTAAPPTPSSAKGGGAAPQSQPAKTLWDELIEEE